LILVNLLENAIEATPVGGAVALSAGRAAERLQFWVRDSGPGYPEHLRGQLFLPCQSTRDGGSGIGLAISKQIADHLGATLELAETSAAGCVFILALPVSACVGPEPKS
jgi:two-component system sensor histidine kinase FlrB